MQLTAKTGRKFERANAVKHEDAAKKTVWLVSPYEVPPFSECRSLRWENLGVALTNRGYQVLTVISDFCHATKTVRGRSGEAESIESGWWLLSLPGVRYRKNVSLRRVLAEMAFAVRLLKAAGKVPGPPSAIVCKEPPCLVGVACVLLKARFRCLLISDVVDLWPELFRGVLPRWMSWLGAPGLWALSGMRRAVFAGADAVVGSCDENRRIAGGKRPGLVVYNGLPKPACRGLESGTLLERASRLTGWRSVAYIGTLSVNYDVPILVDLAERLRASGHPIRVVVAGGGPLEGEVRAGADRYPDQLLFLGRVPFQAVAELLRHCDVGLMPYRARSTVEMPDKFYDYLQAGLAMVTSIRGEVGQIIERHRLGAMYEAENGEALYRAVLSVSADAVLDEAKRRAASLADEYSAGRQFGRYAHFVEGLVLERERRVRTGRPE